VAKTRPIDCHGRI